MKTNFLTFKFEKFHGASNDFLFLDSSVLKSFKSIQDLKNFVRKICDRNKSVGADGILFYKISKNSSTGTTVKILIVNSDGSFAGTCGNALRCFGHKLLRDGFWTGKKNIEILRFYPDFFAEQSEHIHSDEQFVFDDDVFATLKNAMIMSKFQAQIEVYMGQEKNVSLTPLLEHSLAHFGGELDFLTPIYIELSNPHWIFISDKFLKFKQKQFEEFGLFAQTELPRKLIDDFSIPVSNIGMLSSLSKNNEHWKLVVYERGAGLTQCCGSGATAARLALEMTFPELKKSEESYFLMPGGQVSIKRQEADEEGPGLVLKGPSEFVFAATIEMQF